MVAAAFVNSSGKLANVLGTTDATEQIVQDNHDITVGSNKIANILSKPMNTKVFRIFGVILI